MVTSAAIGRRMMFRRAARRSLQYCACVAMLAGAPLACALLPDYGRETRWAEQVAPSVMVGDAVWLDTPDRPRVLALYTPAQQTPLGGVVIVHGAGMQPDFGIVGELRGALAERGFATLSVQMPVLDADALGSEYTALFPAAGDRLDVAVAWLRARNIAPVAVVAHSMGAAMANAWLARARHADVAAFVALGMGVPFAASTLPPVLDVTAERDLPQVLANAPLRALALSPKTCSATLRIAGADHFLAGRANELADAIAPFLAHAFGAECRR
jgi:alpha/beta superfamily hydrolase